MKEITGFIVYMLMCFMSALMLGLATERLEQGHQYLFAFDSVAFIMLASAAISMLFEKGE